MRIATYNVENLFQRARALNQDTWAEGRAALEAHATLNGLLNRARYSRVVKRQILERLRFLGIDREDSAGAFAKLRQNRGKLLKRPRRGPVEVVANGRADWGGWVELLTEPVDEIATQNTGRIIRELHADVLAVVEAESRPALVRFSKQVLPAVGCDPYERIMLIDGNDERGIDVGVMMRASCAITAMRSHVDEVDDRGVVFSRDCPEYFIETKDGGQLVLLVNHLKSKGYGKGSDSDERRHRQALAIRKIYFGLRRAGHEHVAVVGDLNDTPDSAALEPLFARTGLRDISEHPKFVGDGRPGTFGNGTKKQKIDYVLLSPALFGKVTAGGVVRAGVWGGRRGTLFPHLAEITRAGEAASDHAAVWAEVGV